MIGIFDSGSGGLTVLHAIRKRLRTVDILYFGDLKNAPYGEKSREELSRLTVNNIRLLQARGATSIISACNSVSATLAISLFDSLGLSPQHLIEMVGPTVNYFNGFKKPILLFATPATVSSEIYQTAFQMLGITIDAIALPKLAGAIEFSASVADQEKLIAATTGHVDMSKYGAVILACTHYPLAIASFKKMFGNAPFFDPAEAVAERVEKYLWPREAGEGTTRFLLSRDTPEFRARVAQLFRDEAYTVEVVD